MNILVTGATGYIGGKLASRLLQAGQAVTCLVRDPARFAAPPGAQVIGGDALEPASLDRALAGRDVAYYLIHSMKAGEQGFEERDREAARNFATAARKAGVQQLIYVGGLGSQDDELSSHLRSRQETGNVLRQYGPPVTEFRAAVVVGSGSISFEIIRYLAERLPVMICPSWVTTRIQPIAIDDLLDYLCAAANQPRTRGEIIEIGGSTVESYRSMMLLYAKARGLRRYLLQVPVLTPRLSSYWLDFVTPIPAAMSRPLIEGLRSEVICRSSKASEIFPQLHPMSYDQAVRKALARKEWAQIEAICEPPPLRDGNPQHLLAESQGMIVDVSEREVTASAHQAFRVIEGIGGKRGWFFANVLWQARAGVDRLFGGVGMGNGRRDPDHLVEGDTLDFWEVEKIEPDQLLRLRAKMRVPGDAWLQFRIFPLDEARCRLRSTAFFQPRGLTGFLYWWVLYPVHVLIFWGMLKSIASRSEALRSSP